MNRPASHLLRIPVYLWALPTSVVGLSFLLPTLLTGGRAQFVDGVLELHGGVTTWFLDRVAGWFLPGGAAAMTLGHVVLGQSMAMLSESRSHERVHVRQCERWGPFFLPAYGLASLTAFCRGHDAYRENRFEREAYRLE